VVIILQFKGPLKKYCGGKELTEMVIEEEQPTVLSVLKKTTIPTSSISFFLVNNHKVDLDYILKGGDTLTLNPRVAGG
jgi:molybdopterin converting factor small subunit